MEPTAVPETAPEGAFSGRFTGTRRSFIRGVAAAGASTALASTLGTGASLFPATARAAKRTRFSDFTAIAPSADDAFQVPPRYRADVIIGYGDKFADDKGNVFTYGYNNDFLAFFPLDRRGREGLLFINHEYTNPFYLYGYKPEGNPPLPPSQTFRGKSRAEIDQERATIGNAIVHVRKDRDGVWRVVSPSKYNRRIYAGDVPGQPATHYSLFDVTGPLRGDPRVGTEIWGSLGNCSGGTTPWGTAISCEENFDGYGLPLPSSQDFVMGWADPTNDGFPGYPDYNPGRGYRTTGPDNRKYGWVCEHDPYDPSFKPRKHTALGRFRHENTAFRHVPGKQFVLYMGDDGNNDAVYKFISTREFKRGRRSHNLRILEEGTLYVARWEPEGRRRFASSGSSTPINATSGIGRWEAIPVDGLSDTRGYLTGEYGDRASRTSLNGLHYATNRPEDVEVGPDGAVYITFTNNTTRFVPAPAPSPDGVNDSHGAVRRLVEAGNDPTAMTFTWEDFAAGGEPPAGDGFSSPDNLVFDSKGNLWVVTDISTSSLNSGVYDFHDNNAVFMIPTRGPNAGVAFRFANMPVQAEGTGPYFTPDEKTLFVNVQHPGELAGAFNSPAVFGDETTYPSYWPHGNKTLEQNPSEPIPSTVAVTRIVDGRDRDTDTDSDSDSD